MGTYLRVGLKCEDEFSYLLQTPIDATLRYAMPMHYYRLPCTHNNKDSLYHV